MCGGYNSGFISSCEVNIAGEDNWSTMTSLPGARYTVRGLTIDNRVLMIGSIWLSFDLCLILMLSGGYDVSFISDDVYELDPVTEEWRIVSQLFVERYDHAVYATTQDLWQYCTE